MPLPSKGVIYPATSALHNKEALEIRPMTAREEDILMSRAYIKKGIVINKLIESCLTDKSINVEELIAGDKTALMVALRITGYGAEYGVEATCNECGASNETQFDLSTLPIKTLQVEPVTNGSNEFEVVLPTTKKSVIVKFLDGYDEKEMNIISFRMHLKTIQASALKTSFEVLKDVLNDVNVNFTTEGVNITALDNAKVALINMNLKAERFEEYECDQPVTAGVNISNFFKILKIITSNDVLSIDITNKEYMKILIENDAKNSKSAFELKLLWINDDILEIPKIEPTCTTIIPSVDFQRICRDMGNIGTYVSIHRKKSILNISCEGDFANQTTSIDTEQNDFDDYIGNKYSLKFINLFTKATNMCSNMKIQQTTPTEKMPIIFVYDVANLGNIEFYLAATLD